MVPAGLSQRPSLALTFCAAAPPAEPVAAVFALSVPSFGWVASQPTSAIAALAKPSARIRDMWGSPENRSVYRIRRKTDALSVMSRAAINPIFGNGPNDSKNGRSKLPVWRGQHEPEAGPQTGTTVR